MSRSKLISTEVTPIATPSGSPPPSSRLKPRTVRPSRVNGGFVAIPVRVDSPALDGGCFDQHIFLRKKHNDNDQTAVDDATSRTVFAVNLPYGSTAAYVKSGIETILRARIKPAAGSTGNGKGKNRATDADADFTVENVEFIKPGNKRPETILEKEGISHPSVLLAQKVELEKHLQEKQQDKASKKRNGNKRKRGAIDEAVIPQSLPTSSRIHPLFISPDINTDDALDHLFPTPNTIKAHIVLSSKIALQTLLNPSESWTITRWPSKTSNAGNMTEQSFIALGNDSFDTSAAEGSSGRRAKTNDEIIYDLCRQPLSAVQLHVDDWMKLFDATHTGTAASVTADVSDQPKSKRALAREAAAKAVKLAELEKQKAIKKRRVYDDDFLAPELDEDGWTTVKAGGKYGRSAGDINGQDDFEDPDEVRQAELQGFVSGKRSVGVARKAFVKSEQDRVQRDREQEVAALNATLGIVSSLTTTDDDGHGDDSESQIRKNRQEVENSRGSGRGKKKKRTGGIEPQMYAHQRREEAKQNRNLIRERFEEDKQKIAKMKEQKKFRPY